MDAKLIIAVFAVLAALILAVPWLGVVLLLGVGAACFIPAGVRAPSGSPSEPVQPAGAVETEEPVDVFDFDDPKIVDERVREEWFPGEPSHKDKQREARWEHLLARRDQQWEATRRWTKADKEKHELARRHLERKIALSLKPDGHMIIEAGPEDQITRNRAPWQDIFNDTHMWHNQRFRRKLGGSGDIAAAIKSKI